MNKCLITITDLRGVREQGVRGDIQHHSSVISNGGTYMLIILTILDDFLLYVLTLISSQSLIL
jgi:hypothetical protein